MWWQTILLSLREILRNLMRSILTILGIVIGVAAVITLVTLGSGAQAEITGQIESMGANLLTLYPFQVSGEGGAFKAGQPFKDADVAAIEENINGIDAVAPMSQQSLQVIYGNQNRRTTVYGSTNGFMITQSREIAMGDAFTEGQLHAGDSVCILGSSVRDKLFGGQNPIGSIIRLEKISFRVIGVFKSKEKGAMFGMQDEDNFVLIPLRALQMRIQRSHFAYINNIRISAKKGVSTAKVKEDIVTLMHERRRIKEGKENDFMVQDMKEVINMVTTSTNKFTALLAAIAAISLLVGGIGIMNIMLVSVTERTREIGIRLAVGALERDVLIQFLIEAMVLTSFGGIIGIMLGLSAAAVICHFAGLPFVFNPGIVLIALVFSAAVGLIFGFFPARKAAMLDPIEALRHE